MVCKRRRGEWCVRKEWSIFAAIGLGVFIVNLDGSLIAVAFPVLERTFRVDTQVLQWVITAYFLVITSILPIVGKLSDLWGRRSFYITGVTLFAVASILCGTSVSVPQLIVYRILQAFGGSMIMANAMSIITMVFPQSKRGVALGGITSITAVATVLGPSIGGLLIAEYSWRSVFWISPPLAVLSIVLTKLLLKSNLKPSIRVRDKIDCKGASMFASAMIILLLFISNGNTWGWIGWESVITLVVSILLWVMFIRYERCHQAPILNFELFRQPLFTWGNAAGCISFIMLTVPSILLPIYMHHYFYWPIDQIGYMLSTQAISMTLFSLVSGWLTDRFQPTIPAVLGILLVLAGFVCFYFLSRESSSLQVITACMTLGAGIGCFQSPMNVITLKTIPAEQTGVAGGIMATMRNFGRVAGSAIAILLYQTFEKDSLTYSVVLGILLCGSALVLTLLSAQYMMQAKGLDISRGDRTVQNIDT